MVWRSTHHVDHDDRFMRFRDSRRLLGAQQTWQAKSTQSQRTDPQGVPPSYAVTQSMRGTGNRQHGKSLLGKSAIGSGQFIKAGGRAGFSIWELCYPLFRMKQKPRLICRSYAKIASVAKSYSEKCNPIVDRPAFVRESFHQE